MRRKSCWLLAAALCFCCAAPVAAQAVTVNTTNVLETRRQEVRRAVRDDFRAAGIAAGVARPQGLVMIRPAGSASVAQVAPFEANLSDSVLADGLRRALPHLADWPDSTRLLFVRLDDDGPALVTGPLDEHPTLDNQGEVAAAMRRVERSMPLAGNTPAPVLRLLVTRDGRVAFAEVQTSSGEERVDRAALDIGWSMEFRPAIFDDAAVDVWVSLPVRFVVH
jgi:TonB family protein